MYSRQLSVLVNMSVFLLLSIVFLSLPCDASIESAKHNIGNWKSSNEVVLSVNEIRNMPKTGGSFNSLNTYGTRKAFDYYGADLENILFNIVGLRPEASSIKAFAIDGYTWEFSLSEVRETYAGNMKMIIAHERSGYIALDPEPGGSGPLRIVRPQRDESDVNKPCWVQNLRLIVVNPVPQGYEPPPANSIDRNSVVICGAVQRNQDTPHGSRFETETGAESHAGENDEQPSEAYDESHHENGTAEGEHGEEAENDAYLEKSEADKKGGRESGASESEAASSEKGGASALIIISAVLGISIIGGAAFFIFKRRGVI